jgi:hypothetical protein
MAIEQWKITSEEFVNQLEKFLKDSSTNGEYNWDWLKIDLDDGGMTVALTIWDLKEDKE